MVKIMCPIDDRLLRVLGMKPVDVEKKLIQYESSMIGEWGGSEEFILRFNAVVKELESERI